MKENMQELEALIEGLNKYPNIAHLVAFNPANVGFTPAELALIKKYQPVNSLIIYGSLAPGKLNHSVVELIKCEWKQGIIRGRLEGMGWGAALGYNGFRPVRINEQVKIPAHILISPVLKKHWARLDEFEGAEYHRILAKYELDNGEIGVGFIYAINDEKQ